MNATPDTNDQPQNPLTIERPDGSLPAPEKTMEIELSLADINPLPEPTLAQPPDILEQAFDNDTFTDMAFGEMVQSAIDKIGGELLFQMHLDTDDAQHVAAISMGGGEERKIALVILPANGTLRIEPASESANPLASIAEAYAGVAVAYKAAA